MERGGHYSCSLRCPEIKLIFFNSRVVRTEVPSALNGLNMVSVMSSKVTGKNGISAVVENFFYPGWDHNSCYFGLFQVHLYKVVSVKRIVCLLLQLVIGFWGSVLHFT